MSIAKLVVTPSDAAGAYARVRDGASEGADAADGSFGATLSHALGNAIDAGHEADSETVKGLNGEGNITDVVTAVSRAQLALQTTTVVRDRVVQAYQDIMKMSI